MTLKKRSWLSVILFAVIFGTLLLTATFTDLQVSTILTKNALPAGEYLATDFFGVTFECVGSSPVYLILAFCIQVLYWYVRREWKNKGASYIVQLIGLAASTAAYYVFLNETIGYILEHAEAEWMGDMPYFTGAVLFLSAILTALGVTAVRNLDNETLHKLLSFTVAFIAVVIFANVIVAVVKGPVGRMRYRAMNCEGGQSIGGFDNYTRWYVVNGQRFTKAEMRSIFGTTDACRSFPSGHTNAAGMSYGLIMLIDALGIKDRKKKIALWLVPILYTGTVAVSRIVVGAHYFSDVLMGGTIAFVSMIIFREIFICKFSHIKAMFSK